MRKHRRNNQNNMFILGVFTCLLCMMGVGYAAFSTNLNITVKGNIKEMTAAQYLKTKIVNSGDGLYKDTYENDRYIYRGTNPDNYITFNNETWRIIAIENDETLKIIKNVSIGNMEYDVVNVRVNDYCNTQSYGCSLWGSKNTMLNSSGINITQMPRYIGDTNSYTLPDTESSLNIYLNTTYYNSIDTVYKEIINPHIFNIGMVLNTDQSMITCLEQEKNYKWNGNVGLINPTDYIKASLNAECINIYSSRQSSIPCGKQNYLYTNNYYWTMNQSRDYSRAYACHFIHTNGAVGSGEANEQRNIYPVVYLNKDIKLSGNGSSENPYTIK